MCADESTKTWTAKPKEAKKTKKLADGAAPPPPASPPPGNGRSPEGRWESKAVAWARARRIRQQNKEKYKARITAGQRVRRYLLRGLVGLLLLLCLSFTYITSPLGEGPLTALVLRGANAALAGQGLRMSLGSLSGLWSGEVRVFGLKLHDKDGEWLDMAEAVFYPTWGTVVRTVAEGARLSYKIQIADDPTGPGLVLLDLRRATLFNLSVARMPHLPAPASPAPASPAPVGPAQPQPVRILPTWLEVEVGELELVRFGLGSGAQQIFFNVHATAHIADAQMSMRAGIFAAPQSRLLKGPPFPDVLPEDVTRSVREIRAAAEKEGLQLTESGQDAVPENPINSLALPPDMADGQDQTVGQYGSQVVAGPGSSFALPKQAQLSPQQLQGQLPAQLPLQKGQQLPLQKGLQAPAQKGLQLPSQPPLQQGAQLPLQQGQQAPAQQGGQPAPPQDAQQTEDKKAAAGARFASGVINILWDGEFVDARWHVRDTLLLPQWLTGVQRLWSRSRVQAQISHWPPSAELPLQARMASRFGLTTVDLPEKVRASLFSGQAYWDGKALVVKDVNLQVPQREPQVLLRGSLGLSPAAGPGVGLQLKVTNLGSLARTLGLTALASQLDGAVDVGMAVGRGGRHSLWWTKPLPLPRGFSHNAMPGLYEAAPAEKEPAQSGQESGQESAQVAEQAEQQALSSGGGFGSSVSDEELWQDAHASRAPTALHAVLRVDSEALRLPGGKVDKVTLLLRGISMDHDAAPEGTMSRKQAQAGAKAGANPAPPAPPAPAAPAASPVSGDADSADFSVQGLPRGMVGVLRFNAASLFDLGDVQLRSRWMLGGLHGDADVFMGRFSEVQGNIPGLRLGGEMEMTYALPVNRIWPWLDGTLDVNVDNWDALSRLVKSPLKGAGMGLALRMESRLNEAKEPRQYMKAEVSAKQVDAKTFTVSDVRGKVESDHVHALADVLALSLNPNRRQSSPDAPPAGMSLLQADVQVGAGSGGPVQWQWGQCALKVAGEDAHFDANLRGTVQGLLEGVFNFRQRLLQIKKMEVSDSQSGRGGRLLSPLKVALTENGQLAPVDVAFAPQGRLRLSAALKRPAGDDGVDGGTDPANAAPGPASAPASTQEGENPGEPHGPAA